MAKNETPILTSKEHAHVAIKESLGTIRVLAVGVTAYPEKLGFDRLKKCDEDAAQVRATFRDIHQLNADPAHIVLMNSASTTYLPHRGLILNQLNELSGGATESDRLLFYFSGHGHRIDGVDDHFLVPQDAYAESKPDALISMKEVLAILGPSPAKQKIIVLDACLSGPVLLGKKLHAASFSNKFFAKYLASVKGGGCSQLLRRK